MAASYDESLATLLQLPKPILPAPLHFYDIIPVTPIPNPTPTENAFLHHDIGEQVGKTWLTLHNIVIRHEPAIIVAWEKKSTKRRLDIIRGAWGDSVPEMQRPDRACFLTMVRVHGKAMNFAPEDTLFEKSSRKGTALTYPYINEEYLMNSKKILLMMINSRGWGGPGYFYKFNIQATHVGRKINALKIPDLQGFRINLSEQNYGSIIPSTLTFHQFGLTAGETLMAMKIQDRVMKFLIRCCQLILNQNDLQILTSSNTPIRPEEDRPAFLLRKPRWGDVADSIFEAPSIMPPPRFNSRMIIDYLGVRRSAAEDHIWDLRENPGYFATTVTEWSEHQRERISFPDYPDILKTGSPKFWNLVIREVIANAFQSLVAWHILYEHYIGIHRREGENENDALSWTKGTSPDCADAMHIFSYMINHIGGQQIDCVWNALLVSPYFRQMWRDYLGFQNAPTPQGYKHDRAIPTPAIADVAKMMMGTVPEPNFLTLTRLKNTHNLSTFGYSNLVDDIGYGLAKHSMENVRWSACSQRLFSDLGLIASFGKEIDKHQTFSEERPFLGNKDNEEISKIVAEKMAPYENARKGFRHYTRLAALGTPIKGRFDYPVNEKPTLEVTKRMQESEKNLREFWKRADEEYKETHGKFPLDEMKQYLAFDSDMIFETPDWEEPDVEPEKVGSVDRELLVKELCDTKAPRKKKKSKKSKAIREESVDKIGATKPLSIVCKSSQGGENDLVNDNAKTSDTPFKPLMETAWESACVHDSEKTSNAQTENEAAQAPQKPGNHESKRLEMKSETTATSMTTSQPKVEDYTVPAGKDKRKTRDYVVDVTVKVGLDGLQKGCKMATKITTKYAPSQFKELACKMETKTRSVAVEPYKKPEPRTQRKLGLEHFHHSGNFPAPDSCSKKENQVGTKTSTNTAGETEYQKFECIVETFRPGCAAMMSGAIYDELPLTPECFSRIPDCEFRIEVCVRRPALEALISSKPPLDRSWTQAGKKSDDEPGTDCLLAAGFPKGNEENKPPLNLTSSQIPEPEYGRRAWWACQRLKSPDIPIQDDSQRGRRRAQTGHEPNNEAGTGLGLIRGIFAQNKHTDPEKWWSRAMAAHHDSELWKLGSGCFDKFSWYHWPTLGRPRGDSNPPPVNEDLDSGDDEETPRNLERSPSLPVPTKESRFRPEGPINSYAPLEAAAEIYKRFKPYTRPHTVGADPAIHDIYWEQGDSDYEDGPTWRHVEWKKVQDVSELAIAPQGVGATKELTPPKSQPALQDDSSRSHSLSGDSQKEGDLPTAFSTNTTVSPENPKLALAATEPAAQEAAIIAYQQANRSLERLVAAQSEVGSDDSHTLDFDPSESTQEPNEQFIEGGPPISLSRKATVSGTEPSFGEPSWDELSWDEKNVIWDERNARKEAAAASAVADVSRNNWGKKINETELTYMKAYNIYCLELSIVKVIPGLRKLMVDRLWTDLAYDGPLGIEAQDQDVIHAMGESATAHSESSQPLDVDVREESDVSAGDLGPELTVAKVWEECFVGTGIENPEDLSILCEAENKDAIQGLEDFASGNATSQIADAYIRGIIAENLGPSGVFVEKKSSQSGFILSGAEDPVIIQGTEESAESESARAEDFKLRRREAFVAIPWNLIGVRRGVKVPDIKWPVMPKPLSGKIAHEELEQDQKSEQIEDLELNQSPQQDEDSEDEIFQPTMPTSSKEAETHESAFNEPEEDNSFKQSPGEDPEPNESEQDESPEQNESSEGDFRPTTQTPACEETAPEELEQDHSKEQPSSEELQPQESPQNGNAEVDLQPTIQEPPSEETEPRESLEPELPCKKTDGGNKPIKHHSRGSLTGPRPSKSSHRAARKRNRLRNGNMGVPLMHSPAAMTPKESQQEISDAKKLQAITSMVKLAVEGRESRWSQHEEEQEEIELLQTIRSKIAESKQWAKDHPEWTPTVSTSEGVTSNVSTEKKDVELVQSTSIADNEATFVFSIPQDPTGYLNAYCQMSPLTSLVADQKPKHKRQDDLNGVNDLVSQVGLKGEALENVNLINGFASILRELDAESDSTLCGEESEPDIEHDIYYVSKPSYKVFSAIFHDSMVDKHPPPSFIWSEFLVAMQECEFMPMHEYGTLWHFALKGPGLGIQIHQPHYDGIKEGGGLNIKVSAEYARNIGRRMMRNYGYGKEWFLLKTGV